MRRLLIAALLFSVLLGSSAMATAAAPSARGAQPIHVFVAVPPTYTSPVTPEQARIAVSTWLGQPTDAPCLGQYCTVEGYFRSQLGKVFDYDLTVVPGAYPQPGPGGVDACNQGGIDQYWFRSPTAGYSLSGNRTMVLVLGGGGWAGHNPGTKQSGAFGMGGDWGVQAMWDVPLPCVPAGIAEPFMDRGFAHEFEGMMGMYRNGATYDYFCCERAMEAQHKKNLLSWSRSWLRNP